MRGTRGRNRPAYLLGALLLATGAACSSAAPTSPTSPVTAPPSSATATEIAIATATVTPTTIATPTVVAIMAPGASGDQVRDLQARLKQLNLFDATVDGVYADATTAGVRGLQSQHSLTDSGVVDRSTWDALVAATRQPTAEELAGHLLPGPALLASGSTGSKVRDLQARLKQIGWWSGDVTDRYGPQTVEAVAGFQAKRGIPVTGEVDQRTLDRLSAMTRKPTSDELNNVKPKPVNAGLTTAGLDPRCLTGRALCVSKGTNKLTWVVDGVPVVRVDVRFGSQELPTREGAFAVFAKSRDHVSTIYHTSMPYAMFFSGGQAVHYSPDFAARGYSGASHGCINVRDLRTITWLFDQVRLGDAVIVYR